jgi:pimeloyl-ACP methyl ester carboxylesterase
MDIYLLPGLGTDRRLFSRLQLPGYRLHLIEWPAFAAGCTLAQVAGELLPQVHAACPHVLVGVSMGGMVAQELALLTRPRHVVLVSSVTGPHEYPVLLRVSRRLRLDRFITDAAIRITWPLRRPFGVRDRAISDLLCRMAFDQGGRQIRRGTSAILRWQGSRWQGPLYRIHGDADRVLPLRFPVNHVVPGATHPMVITRAEEVGRALLDFLTGLQQESPRKDPYQENAVAS